VLGDQLAQPRRNKATIDAIEGESAERLPVLREVVRRSRVRAFAQRCLPGLEILRGDVVERQPGLGGCRLGLAPLGAGMNAKLSLSKMLARDLGSAVQGILATSPMVFLAGHPFTRS
jgi:hypothetical protein